MNGFTASCSASRRGVGCGIAVPPSRCLRCRISMQTGIPSTLARRRPDVREAEANLHAAHSANWRVGGRAVPSFTLSGQFGLRNSESTGSPTGQPLQVLVAGLIPIFGRERLVSQRESGARAQQGAAVLDYRRVVLTALGMLRMRW